MVRIFGKLQYKESSWYIRLLLLVRTSPRSDIVYFVYVVTLYTLCIRPGEYLFAYTHPENFPKPIKIDVHKLSVVRMHT